MPKTPDPDEALHKALKAASTGKRLMQAGAGKGLFPTGPNGKIAADTAVRDGYLVAHEERTGSARSAPKVFGTITEKGLRKLFEAESPRAALEALLPVVQAIGKPPEPPDPIAFRAEIDRATAACVASIQESFSALQAKVMAAVTPASVTAADAGPVLSVLRDVLQKMEQPPLRQEPIPKMGSKVSHDIENDIADFVAETARRTTVGCQLDVLMTHLRQTHPDLTIGEFHNALRRLHEAERIRLGGWPRMLDDLPEPELALFVSSKVMYYAQPAH